MEYEWTQVDSGMSIADGLLMSAEMRIAQATWPSQYDRMRVHITRNPLLVTILRQ